MKSASLLAAINSALAAALEEDDSVVVYGEDVGVNGGVFQVTAGLQPRVGARSCFDALPTLPRLAAVIDARAGLAAEQEGTADNSSSYTVKLLRNRNLRLKKLGEEAAELSVACADAEPRRVAEEAADLLYHSLVACRSEGVRLEDVLGILADRFASAPRLARPVSSVRPSRSS